MAKKMLEVGDRVEGGQSETEDYDRGRVRSIDHRAHVATVVWDSFTTTEATIDSLDVIGPEGPDGLYPWREE